MKETLENILNALQEVETKGKSSAIIVDCSRELFKVIQELEDKKGETDE